MNTVRKNLPKLKVPRRSISTITGLLRGLKGRHQEFDPIQNPGLLARLSSYASIVAGRKVQCVWGDSHQTDLSNIIILNPHDPKDGSPAERKIVLTSALEHEVRGHWKYTPRDSYEIVCNLGRGSACSGFDLAGIGSKFNAIMPIFNILEDGRVETRLRWEMPESYKIIALGDRIRPRWRISGAYTPAIRAYSKYLESVPSVGIAKCMECQQKIVPQNAVCESCFTTAYRWEQITGLLLTASLPPHIPPITIVENEVREGFDACVPWLVNAIRGTSSDVIQSSIEIIKILIRLGMVPEHPDTPKLMVGEAVGHKDIYDSEMSERVQRASGIKGFVGKGQSKNQQADKENVNFTEKNRSDQEGGGMKDNQAKNGNKTQQDLPANIQSTGQESEVEDEAGKDSGDEKKSLSNQKLTDQLESTSENQSPESKPLSSQGKELYEIKSDSGSQVLQLEKLAELDLQNFDFATDLDVPKALKNAQSELDFIQMENEEELARQIILRVSGGVGAGPGSDEIDIRRTDRRREIYQILETRNRERGQRFAKEIRDLLSILLRPQKYQRLGHLDRKQLVNAVARRKDTVFIRPKIVRDLDLAISINLDISGSMAAYNRPILLDSSRDGFTEDPAQLMDAVTICAIGLNQLGVDFEVRAFGSLQWLAKTFYERECFGLAGLACEYNGGTKMTPAIRYSRIALLGRLEKDQLLVVMTDGYPFMPEEAVEEIHLAKQAGIRVLGLLFDSGAEARDRTDPAMAQLFGPNGFLVIHSLEQFPTEVGRAIKNIILGKTLPY